MARRYEVILSIGGFEYLCKSRPGGWSVRVVDEASTIIDHIPYDAACAIARHMNGHDAESGDVEALVDFCIDRFGVAP